MQGLGLGPCRSRSGSSVPGLEIESPGSRFGIDDINCTTLMYYYNP